MRLRYTQAGAPELGLKQSAKRGWDHKQPARARILAEQHSNDFRNMFCGTGSAVIPYAALCAACARSKPANAQLALSIHCRS